MNPSVSINGVALFRAGDYGAKGQYTSYDVRKLAESYDPVGDHEAGVTIDHAQEGPRFGRISKVYAKGDVLFGDLEVIPEFAEHIKRGLYDKRSIEFYRDSAGKPEKIRAVTFLGAQPPEVKGLPPLPKFSESESEIIIFQESSMDETMKAELLAAFKGALSEVLAPALANIHEMLKPAEEMGEMKDKAKMEEDGSKPALEIKVETETEEDEKEGDPLMSETTKFSEERFAKLEAELAVTKARALALEADAKAARKETEKQAFLAKFSEKIVPAQRPAVSVLFDALHDAGVVTFSEMQVAPVSVLASFLDAQPAHNLDKKTSPALESFGESNPQARESVLFSEAEKLVKSGKFASYTDAVVYLESKKG